MLDKNIIKATIDEKYEKIKDKYKKERILGIFTVGLANYGFARTEDEIKLIAIYVPTFEELCIGGDPINYFDEETKVRMIDIRVLYNAAIQHTEAWLEILFSDPCIINEKYKYVFEEYFLKNRELISHYCDKERIVKAKDRAIKCIEMNDYFEATRLWMGAKLFFDGKDCEDCFHIKDTFLINYLTSVQEGKFTVDCTTMLEDLDKIIAAVCPTPDERIDALIKNGIVEIMNCGLLKEIPLEQFLYCLTPLEKQAFSALQKRISEGEGYISVTTLVNQSKISRPVFKALLHKMSANKVAEIKNAGPKGTYVKIKNEPSLN